MPRFDTVDAYIANFSPETRATLETVRQTIRAAAPGTEEAISYDIPTFTLHGRYVVYFAGWKRHISIYPVPDFEGQLAQDIAPYLSGKGTLKFPLDKPIPYDLIGEVVKLLIQQRVEARA
jgi:uncharacterized protein YdhG (YjbR/CyaY superfamily)